MRSKATVISDDVRGILSGVTFDDAGMVAKLNCPQLDHGIYTDVNEVLTRLGGKWKGGKVQGFVFAEGSEAIIRAVAASGIAPPKNPMAFFPTPGAVIDKMAEHWRTIPEFFRIHDRAPRFLEPSAGRGVIAIEWRCQNANGLITCVEIDPINAAILRSANCFDVVVEGDFLSFTTTDKYDVIAMNPPFSVQGNRLAYIDHIRHAHGMLAGTGILTAIAPSGFVRNEGRKEREFAAWVEESGNIYVLDDGTFKESGTGVNTVMIVIGAPHT